MHSSGSHLSKDMLDLIKSIGDSRSKQEEDKIIMKEKDVLKVKIKESGVNAKKMKEYLIRAIYIEMLGHDAPFAHLYSVNLTQDKNILNKRVGYLACNLMLSESSEFLIMLVASLQKDIQSNNWVEVGMALTSIVKFASVNSIIMQALTEPIIKLLDHKNEHIKKKAVMCLYKFHQVNPGFVSDVNDKMKRLLCDYDPAVMAATLNYFAEVIKKNPENFKDLTSSFTVILKQIIEHKLPREFDYHRFPAPWIQVKLLEILSMLGRDDQSTSENMYEILTQVLRRADDTGINIGYAIVYQCLRTICIIYPNHHLIEQASTTISRFLSSDSPNLRCTGINGLALIIQINPGYVMNHQQVIVDCLEENDETLKKNTFDLLYKMTTTENVEVIVDRMMKYLKNSQLESVGRKDILTKITELAERFAPDKVWFIKIMNQLFVNFGELITDEILSKLIKLINEWEGETDEEEFRTYTIDNYSQIIDNYPMLPDSLVKVLFILNNQNIVNGLGNWGIWKETLSKR
jgi:AP-4 complex subunit epsilon-1